jgi:hypothetical protein
LELASNAALDGLQSFAIEANIVPEKLAGQRRKRR